MKYRDLDTSKLKPRLVPFQLTISGDGPGGEGIRNGQTSGSRILIDQRVRKGPYWHLSQAEGAWCYQVYNRIYHPRAYIRPEDGGLRKEYEYLTKHVTMWNVAVERQIQVKGPDAESFVDYVITRKASSCKPGHAKYVILCNIYGGIINDPVLLRLSEDEFWFSAADSDLGIYLQGVNHDRRWNVEINEIDVAPVQIQGPKALALMRDLVGPQIEEVPYYGLLQGIEINGVEVVISRTGFSGELGYEIYLFDATRNAEILWNAVLEAGKKHNLRVIAPGHHRRIEAGILSWGQDMDIETNPFEVGLGASWMVDFDKENFIGRDALLKIKEEGVSHLLVGVRMGGKNIEWYPADYYHVLDGDQLIGYITSAWYSETIGSNIGYAFVPKEYAKVGTKLTVLLSDTYADGPVEAEVCKTPFKKPHDPGSALLTTGKKLAT